MSLHHYIITLLHYYDIWQCSQNFPSNLEQLWLLEAQEYHPETTQASLRGYEPVSVQREDAISVSKPWPSYYSEVSGEVG